MFLDGESADEQVVLLYVRGNGRQHFAVDRHAVDGPDAGVRHVPVASECQRVQQGRFPGAARAHQGQQFARPRRTAHWNDIDRMSRVRYFLFGAGGRGEGTII